MNSICFRVFLRIGEKLITTEDIKVTKNIVGANSFAPTF